MNYTLRTISLIVTIALLVPLSFVMYISGAIFQMINGFTYYAYKDFEFPIEQYRQAYKEKGKEDMFGYIEYANDVAPNFCKIVHILVTPILLALQAFHNGLKSIYF